MFVQSSRARSLLRGRWLAIAALASGLTTLAGAASAAPQISGFNATEFKADSHITIYGTGFGDVQGTSYVLYGDRPIPILAWTDLAITGYLSQAVVGTPLGEGIEPNVVVVRMPANERSNTVPLPLAVAQTPTPTDPTAPAPTDPAAPAPTTPSASENQLLNDALLVERLAVAFYNANATKPYLSVGVTDPGNTPPAPTQPGTENPAPTPAPGTLQDPTPPVTDTPTPGTTTGSNLDALRSMVEEIRQHHAQHVATIEQALGTNAQPVPTFQNLDAPTLQQFLTMAQTIEDFTVSAHQGLLNIALGITTGGTTTPDGTTPPATVTVNPNIILPWLAIALDNARHAGAIRAYRKTASTADGGDPNITLTEDGGPLNVARNRDQILAFIQPYLATGAIAPGTGTDATPADGTNTNPGTGTGTGTPPNP